MCKKPALFFLWIAFFVLPVCGQPPKTYRRPTQLLIVSGPEAKNLSKHQCAIVWETNAVSSSVVEWGLTGQYGRIARGKDGGTHKAYLSGLKGGEVYHYRALSKTPDGFQTASGDEIFETPTPDLIIKQVIIPKQVTVGNSYIAQVTVMVSGQPLDGPYTVQIYRSGSFQSVGSLNKNTTLLGEVEMPPQPAKVYRTANISFQMAPLPGLEEGFETGNNFVVKVAASENEKILGNNERRIPFVANP